MSNICKVYKRSCASTLKNLLHDFPDLFYDGAKIVCRVCERNLMCWKKQGCAKHVNSLEHKNRKNGAPTRNVFIFNLILMMVTCNLSLNLLENQLFKNFWNKYNPDLKLPTRRTTSAHVVFVREYIEKKIRSILKNQFIWLCIGESTDRRKNSIIHVVVRVLDHNKPTFPLLLASKRLQECTSAAITRVILTTLENFQVSMHQVLMLMSDGTETMRLVGRSFVKHCSNCLHVTCNIYALHLVTDTVRQCYPEVDVFISSTKKVFNKSRKPLQPILPRGGTWLQTAFYYAEHFEEVKAVILQFKSAEDTAIKENQIKCQDISLGKELQTIHSNYKCLHNAIQQLQNKTLLLVESLQIIDEVYTKLGSIQDAKSNHVVEKLESALMTDPNFIRLKQICNGLATDPLTECKDCFNYACTTSLDVGRSFLKYNDIYSPLRTNLNETTVETYLMLSTYYDSYPEDNNGAPDVR